MVSHLHLHQNMAVRVQTAELLNRWAPRIARDIWNEMLEAWPEWLSSGSGQIRQIVSSQGPGNDLRNIQNLYVFFHFLCLDCIFQHLGALRACNGDNTCLG